ncbi:MAG TPA: Gfo/Idh/MocA family oxidoreductase [Roseiflexaceae bacterium]|nr:Gfo/Idh/MocA family oxidoreductase [Roseiflexaceae bacterium]
MKEKLRVGIVGTGIGRFHADGYRALPEHFELVAVCDIDAARARAFAGDYGVPRAVTSLDELCAMDDLDVIDVCTPPSLHFAHVTQALAAGKHAICEKPLVGSLREADDLAEVEARSGRRVMPIFQYRFGHGLQKLRRLVETGAAGQLYLATVETAWRRRAAYYDVPWRGKWATELGGAVLGHAIHAHDMLGYIAGPPRSVFCRAATLVNPIEVEDTAAAALELAGGGLATLAVTLGSAQEITRHRFCFSGLVAESNTRPYTNSGEPWTFTPDTPEDARRIEEALAGFEPLPEGYPGQFLRFHRALHEDGELPVTLSDARASIELVTALYDSARSGLPVALPIAPDHPLYGGWLP